MEDAVRVTSFWLCCAMAAGCGGGTAGDGGSPDLTMSSAPDLTMSGTPDLAMSPAPDLLGVDATGLDLATPAPDLAAPRDLATAADLGGLTIVHVSPGGSDTYSPMAVTISAGSTVRWIFDESSHNVTSGVVNTPDGKFCYPTSPDGSCTTNRGLVSATAGANYDQVFPTKGSFPYFCGTHLFTGMVTVN
jgi:plastocyanin